MLVPYPLVSALLTMAERGLFEPRWSEQILEETQRTLTGKLGVSPEKAGRRLNQMRQSFPEASVYGFEDLIEDMTCDAKDRHVLAAAVATGADLLVTTNLKDFPEASFEQYGIEVIPPEVLLNRFLNYDEQACIQALQRDAAQRRKPPLTIEQLLAQLATPAPTFANTVHQMIVDGDAPMSDIPALVTSDPEASPLFQAMADPDLTDPLHVAVHWWSALMNRDEHEDILDFLTFRPSDWKGYQWAADLLDDKSIATKVYRAVDAPDDLSFVRFVPEIAQSSQVFSAFRVKGPAFLTLVRLDDDTWRAWGLGSWMVSARDVGLNSDS